LPSRQGQVLPRKDTSSRSDYGARGTRLLHNMLKIMQFVIAVAPIEPKSNNAVLTQAIVIVVRRRSIWGHVALYFLRGKPAIDQWQSSMRGCVTCAIISEERADVGSFLALALAASRSMCTWFVLSGFCQPRWPPHVPMSRHILGIRTWHLSPLPLSHTVNGVPYSHSSPI